MYELSSLAIECCGRRQQVDTVGRCTGVDTGRCTVGRIGHCTAGCIGRFAVIGRTDLGLALSAR
jgi:hypothetical protein